MTVFDIERSIRDAVNILDDHKFNMAVIELQRRGYQYFSVVKLVLNYSHEYYCAGNFDRDSYIHINYISQESMKPHILFGFKHQHDYMQFELAHD